MLIFSDKYHNRLGKAKPTLPNFVDC